VPEGAKASVPLVDVKVSEGAEVIEVRADQSGKTVDSAGEDEV